MKVLLTDGGSKQTLGIVRSLGKLGYLVDCIGDSQSICGFSKYLRKISYPLEKFNEKFILEFVDFIKKSDYDILIPIGGNSVQLISKYKKNLNKYVNIELADDEKINFCFNKLKLLNFAIENEINVPKIYNMEDINKIKNQIKYPVVIKEQSELSKIKPIYSNSFDELINILENRPTKEIPIVQEYFRGTGIGFFTLYENGKLVRYFMHKRLRETPRTGGSSVSAISIYDSDIYNKGKKLLDNLKWHGVAMVEFKKNFETNEIKLIEVNPKFWGSHDLAIASGINFAEELIKMSFKQLDKQKLIYKTGIRYFWPLNGDVQNIFKKNLDLRNIIVDIINPKVRSNFLLSDFKPNLFAINVTIIKPILRRVLPLKFLSRVKKIGVLGSMIRLITEFSGIPILRYSKVTENLFIGMQHGKLGKIYLKIKGFKSLLNLRLEFDDKKKNLTLENYLHIPLEEFQVPTINEIKDGVKFIKESILLKKKIYIHCREGISRAPMFACAYLIYDKDFTVEESIAEVKKNRFFINILENQINVLKEYSEIAKKN